MNTRTHSSETNKLRNIYTIGRRARNIFIKKMGNLLFQNKNHPVYHKFKKTMPFVIDKFKSKNGASVSEEFRLIQLKSNPTRECFHFVSVVFVV